MMQPVRYIGKPVRSLQTMLRVLSKTRSAQPSVVPDGIYGSDTALAVSAFQRQEGLAVTGATDDETLKRIASAYSSEAPLVLPAVPLEIIWQPHDVIAPGERNLHLYIIQAMFYAIGKIYSDAPQIEISGVHDERSVNSVEWLQERSGLPISGSINQIDWLHLTKLYRTTVGDGKAMGAV